MIAIATRDDWSAVEITTTTGAGADVWTCPATVHDAYSAVAALASYLSMHYGSAVGTAVDSVDGRVRWTLTVAAATWTAPVSGSAAATTLLSPAGAAATSEVILVGHATAAASIVAQAMPSAWRAESPAAGSGAASTLAPGHAPPRRRVEVGLVEVARVRLLEALAQARHPREAWLRDDAGGWALLPLGRVDLSGRLPTLRASLEVSA